MNIKELIEISQQTSFRMPSGLSREERRKWAKDISEYSETTKREYNPNEVLLTIQDSQTGKWIVCNPAVFETEDCSGEYHSLYTKEEIKEFENRLNGFKNE